MLAGTLAALATLAGAGLAATALAAHECILILAGLLAGILAGVATVATRHGHFIYSYLRFFLRKLRLKSLESECCATSPGKKQG
jgi:hypothetical protein